MSNINTHSLKQGINEVKQLIEDLRTSIEQEESIDEKESFHTIIRTDLGTLTLSQDNLDKQTKALTSLSDAVNGKWSHEAIDQFLQDAIFQCLETRQKSPQEFHKTLETALRNLKSSLSQPLKTFEFYNVVLGLDVGNETRVIGNVEFFHVDENNLNLILKRFEDITDDTSHTDEEKKNLKKVYEQLTRQYFGGTAAARLRVSAGDVRAARRISTEELKTTLDV